MDEKMTHVGVGERLLKGVDVAEFLNVSKAFAYRLMQQGKIRTVVIEGARRVRPEDLRDFIESRLVPAETGGMQ